MEQGLIWIIYFLFQVPIAQIVDSVPSIEGHGITYVRVDVNLFNRPDTLYNPKYPEELFVVSWFGNEYYTLRYLGVKEQGIDQTMKRCLEIGEYLELKTKKIGRTSSLGRKHR